MGEGKGKEKGRREWSEGIWNNSVQKYNLIVAGTDTIIRDCKRLEKLSITKKGSRNNYK
jgi:hypothetical protein